MNGRFHHRLAWIAGAALVGAAACGGGGAGETGKPGGRDGGTEQAACVGPTWFGGLDEGARNKVIQAVCAGDKLGPEAGPSCEGAYAVGSDDEIAGVLSAVDQGQANQARIAQANATAPPVKDFADTLGKAHGRAAGERRAMLRRNRLRAKDDTLSRDLAKGFGDAETALHDAHGAGFDREFVGREIVQQARSVEMFDALAPQAKAADVEKSVKRSRELAGAHLQLACGIWSKLPGPKQSRIDVRPVTTTRAPTEPAPSAPVTQAPAPPVTQSPAPPVMQTPDPPVTQAPVTQSPPQEPSPPVTQSPTQEPAPPVTQSPIQAPPVTQAPVTQSPTQEPAPPVTQAPVTQSPTQEPAPPVTQAPAPAPTAPPCEPCPP